MTESNYLKEKTVRPVIGFIVFYILETIDIPVFDSFLRKKAL